MSRLMDAFKEANLDPSDNLVQGLEKIANVEKCRKVLLPMLFPDTKVLMEANSKLMKMAQDVKERSISSEEYGRKKQQILQEQIINLKASSTSLLKTAKEESDRNKSLQSQLKELKEKNEELITDLKKLKDVSQESGSLAQESQQQIESLKSEIDTAREKYAALSKEYSESLKEKEASITVLSKELEEQKESNTSLRGQIAKLEEEGKISKAGSIVIVKKSHDLIQSLTSDLNTQQAEMASLRQRINELQKGLDIRTQGKDTGIECVLEVIPEKPVVESEWAEAQNKISSLELDLKETRDNVSLLSAQLAESKKKASLALGHLAKAKTVINHNTKQNQELLLNSQAAKNEINSLTLKLRESQESASKLKEECEKLKSLQQQLDAAEKQISTLSEEKDKVTKSLEHSKALILMCTGTLRKLNEDQNRLVSITKELKEKERRDDEIKKLELKLEKAVADLGVESASKRQAIDLLTKSSLLIASLKEKQEYSMNELHKREDICKCVNAQYEYLQNINRQLLAHLRSAKQVIASLNEVIRGRDAEISTLKSQLEEQQSKLLYSNGQLKSSLERLQLLSNDYMAVKTQREEATNMMAKLMTALDMNSAYLKSVKVKTGTAMSNLSSASKSLEQDKAILAQKMVGCLNLLNAVRSDYERYAVNQMSMEKKRKEKGEDMNHKISHFIERLANVKESNSEMVGSYDDLQSANKQLILMAYKLQSENEQLKNLITRYKTMSQRQSSELQQLDSKWATKLAQESQTQLLLIRSAKDKLAASQATHKADIDNLNQYWRQEISSLNTYYDGKVYNAQLETVVVAKKLAMSVEYLKSFQKGALTNMSQMANLNKKLRADLNESHLKTITLRDFTQHRLVNLREQLSNLSISCQEQQRSKDDILRYCERATKYNEYLRDILVSYKQRLQTYKAIHRAQTSENVVLKRQLLTAKCRSTEPYIDELERQLTLMQGQLAEANEHNVRMMELLQIKLSQDLHGRVTKQQAEREVLLLREMATK